MVLNSVLLTSTCLLFLVSLYRASISASDVSWRWVVPDVPLAQMMVADVVSPAVFEAMASVVQPHPPSIPPNGTRSLSNKQILKACSLPVIMSVLSAIVVVFNREFKLSHGRHSASSSLSTVLRSAISGSSSRTLFLALIFAVTVALTLGLLVVQSLLLSANSSTTFDVLRIVLFAHVGIAGIYVMVSALWDTLERRVANEESGISQGEVAAEEDTLGGDDEEQDIGSLPVSNLQALSTTAYMSARSTNGEPASEIPEAQVTSSTGNTPSNQSVATVPEQNGASLMAVGESGARYEVPDSFESAIPSAETLDHVSQDLYSSIAPTPLRQTTSGLG